MDQSGDRRMLADQIVVGQRHRQELGDIASLARSIQELGLLHPLVVNNDGHLIAGRRRLEAVRELGWLIVPVHVVYGLSDALKALQAERDENTCRKDFTPSEAVAIGKALEELEKPKAKQRQAQKLKKGNATPVVENCHHGESNGKTRDKVADAVGMSGRTYEKAKKVVDAAEEEPEQFGPVKDEMDKTGKVDPAFQKVKGRPRKSKEEREAAKLERLPDLKDLVREWTERATRWTSELERAFPYKAYIGSEPILLERWQNALRALADAMRPFLQEGSQALPLVFNESMRDLVYALADRHELKPFELIEKAVRDLANRSK